MGKKKYNIIWAIFLIFFGVNMLTVLFLSVLKTENHLPISKMIILPILLLLFFCLLFLVQQKIEKKLNGSTSWIARIYIIIFGLVLYLVAVSQRCDGVHDQAIMYQGALYFAGLSDEISWQYFARCNNNIAPTVILSIIFRIGSLGGRVDPYYFAVLTNVLHVVVAMYCVFKLGEKRNHTFAAWIGIIIFSIYFFPLAGHTMSLYTDAMSFSYGIVGFCLWERSRNEENRRKYWSMTLFIAVIFVIGALIKITALIPLIAMIIYALIYREKCAGISAFCAIILVVCFYLFANFLTTKLPCESLRDSYGTPKLSYWIAIGIKGNGGYIDNQHYSNHLTTIHGMKEKEKWTREYIVENAFEFTDRSHLVQKLRYNFANGDMGCGTYVQIADKDSLFYKLMHYNGDYFWRYTMVMTAIMYFVYICMIFAIFVNLICPHQRDSILSVALISIFGLMLYLMIFEANHRHLYNHLPWFVLAAECGLSDICMRIRTRNKKDKQEGYE